MNTYFVNKLFFVAAVLCSCALMLIGCTIGDGSASLPLAFNESDMQTMFDKFDEANNGGGISPSSEDMLTLTVELSGPVNRIEYVSVSRAELAAGNASSLSITNLPAGKYSMRVTFVVVPAGFDSADFTQDNRVAFMDEQQIKIHDGVNNVDVVLERAYFVRYNSAATNDTAFEPAPAEKLVLKGYRLPKADLAAIAAYDKYAFKYWGSGNGVTVSQVAAETEVTGNFTLTADWYNYEGKLAFVLGEGAEYGVEQKKNESNNNPDFSGDEAVYVPAKYHGIPVTKVKQGGFKDNTTLKRLVLPDTVTYIESDAFFGCKNLADINLGENSPFVIEDGVIFSSDKKTLLSYPAGKTGKGYTIPEGVTAIGTSAFASSILETIIIPNSVTVIGYQAFYGCKFTSIAIPSSVTTIYEFAFNSCAELASITIPASVTSIGDRAFLSCSALKAINVEGENPEYATDKHGELFTKDKSTLICLPQGRDDFDYTGLVFKDYYYEVISTVSHIAPYALYGCKKINTIELSGNLQSIGEYAFAHCSGLKDIVFNGTKAQWNLVQKDDKWNKQKNDEGIEEKISAKKVECNDGDIDI